MTFFSSGSFCRPGLMMREDPQAEDRLVGAPPLAVALDEVELLLLGRVDELAAREAEERLEPRLVQPHDAEVPLGGRGERGREPELLAVEAEDVAELLGRVRRIPSTWSPSESRSLPAPSPRSLNGFAHGFQIPISASRCCLVDDAVRVSRQLGRDDADGLVDREQRGADPDRDPARLGRGEVAGVGVGDRLARHLGDQRRSASRSS